MKEGFDKEMDSLLRRRARGTAELRLWGDGAGDGLTGAHLDADELGAFSEGALPPSARVAAISHLADCERCRGVAVGLARVAGAGVEVKHQAVAATVPVESERMPAWRALLASLFAPRVMRFAVPVLALSLVGVVSYVALRSNPNSGMLEMAKEGARQNTASQTESSASAPSTAATADANVESNEAQPANAAPTQAPLVAGAPSAAEKGHGEAGARPADAVADSDAAQPTTAAEPPPPPPPAAAAEGPAELSKSAPKTSVTTEESGTARASNKEKAENRDKSARSAEVADDALSNDVAQRRNAQSRAQAQMPDGGDSRSQKRADNNAPGNYGGGSNVGSAAPPRESERAGSRSETPGRARSPRPAEKKDAEDEPARGGDMRAAAGHRFRREGNAWVDVNYRSSMASTGVRRGTDAFRALVAEVPEVGRVAAAIGGEVIVVVGGRAYRIR